MRPRVAVRGYVLALALVTAFVLPVSLASAQTPQRLSFRLIDSELGNAVPGAVVELLRSSSAPASRIASDSDGCVALAGVPPGTYSLVISAVGFETRRIDGIVVPAAGLDLGTVVLDSYAFLLNPIVVTASRATEKALDAPASVHTVHAERIERQPAITVVDHLQNIPGVDVVHSGISRPVVSVRGFQTAYTEDLLVLTDNRWSSLPSLRFNAFNMMPSTSEDIERIEVVLGPGSALYGPNTVQGVLHIITKSPFDYPGTTASLSVGERSIFQTSLRHAGIAGERFGYKLSGSYFRGDDWEYVDPVEQQNRQAAISGGADPSTLLIGRRDFEVERFTVDARMDFRVDDQTTVIASGGVASNTKGISLVSTNAAQTIDWLSYNTQLRLRRGNFFAQTYLNWSDAGDSYSLRSGQRIVDTSKLFVAQIQHAASWGTRQRFTYGADLVRTMPETGGTIHGSNEDRDDILEVGGYVQSETDLSDRLELVAAARLDRHDYLERTVFSPRLGLVFTPREGNTFRATYNRAFRMPGTTGLFLDLVSSPTLGGLPYAIRVVGMSKDGYTFPRSCGGLCMRSPFTPANLGGPGQLVPANAALFWSAAVQVMRAINPGAGAVLGLMAAPTTQVGSSMLVLNPATAGFDPVTDVQDIGPPRPPIHNTFEVGYKGLLNQRLLLGVDLYYTKVRDFISQGFVATPNVFLDPRTLGAYIASEAARLRIPLTAADVTALTTGMASIPVGTVTPEAVLGDGPDILLTFRNFGDIDWFGVDLAASLRATDRLTISGSYSFASENLWPNVDGFADIHLNGPRNKASLGFDFVDARRGLAAQLGGRWVEGFPYSSGVYVGPVEGRGLVDARVNVALPFSPETQVTLAVSNLLDDRHREMPGAPDLGRLLLLRLSRSF